MKSLVILKHIISFIFKGRNSLIYIIRNKIYEIVINFLFSI